MLEPAAPDRPFPQCARFPVFVAIIKALCIEGGGEVTITREELADLLPFNMGRSSFLVMRRRLVNRGDFTIDDSVYRYSGRIRRARSVQAEALFGETWSIDSRVARVVVLPRGPASRVG